MGAGMGLWLKKSLYLSLLWRMVLGVAVMAAAERLLPQWWMAVGTGLVVALWMAAWATSAVTDAIELIEPAATAIVDRERSWPEAPYRQMEPLMEALHGSAAEVVRQLEASSESRLKLEALLDSMQDAGARGAGGGGLCGGNGPDTE